MFTFATTLQMSIPPCPAHNERNWQSGDSSTPQLKTTTTKKRKKSSIASAVAKGVSDAIQSKEKEQAEKKDVATSKADLKALIISAFDEEPKKPAKKATVGSAVTPSENVAGTATVTLASILKQAKNANK